MDAVHKVPASSYWCTWKYSTQMRQAVVDTCVLNEQKLLRYVLQTLLMEPYFCAQLRCLIGGSAALGARVNTNAI